MRLIKDIIIVVSSVSILLLTTWIINAGNDLMIEHFGFDSRYLIVLIVFFGPFIYLGNKER